MMVKRLVFVFFVPVLLCCNSKSGDKKEQENSSTRSASARPVPDSIVHFLINSASIDFGSHQPPTPIDFRGVRVGYIETSANEKTFVLCGEFLSQEKKEWEQFATVKTSGYEQYIGNQAVSFCKQATVASDDEIDLSTELKSKLEEVRKENEVNN